MKLRPKRTKKKDISNMFQIDKIINNHVRNIIMDQFNDLFVYGETRISDKEIIQLTTKTIAQ